MAFNGAHAFTLGFLLLVASGGAAEAAAFGNCESPSRTFRGSCLGFDDRCAAACRGEFFMGDTSKPFTGGHCSATRWLDDREYHVGPSCICTIDCGPSPTGGLSPTEQVDPETHHHHPPPPSEDPEPPPPHHHAPPPHHHHYPPPPSEVPEVSPPHHHAPPPHHHHAPPPPSEVPEPSPPHHHAPPPHHHHHPPPPPEQEPPAQGDE